MRFRIKALLGAALLAVGAGGIAAPAVAQDDNYPSKQVTFVCAFPAGSGADVLVRYFAIKVGELIDQTIIVENKPGAAGNIATEYVIRSKPDGYTVYVHGGSSVVSSMHLYNDPPFDVLNDLQVATTINRHAFMVTVAANSPYQTLAELTAAMKEKGDKVTYGVTANSGKVMGALYNKVAGLQGVEVVYKTGNDVIPELDSGALDYALSDPIVALAEKRKGTVRVLGVATDERLDAAPDIPTMEEAGAPGVVVASWFAAMVPKATPRPIVDKLSELFHEVLKTDETRAFLNLNGGDPWLNTPDDSQKILEQAYEDWGRNMAIANIPKQ